MGVPQIQLPQDAAGRGTVEAQLGNHVPTRISGGKITWIRDTNGSWSCTVDATIGAKYAISGSQHFQYDFIGFDVDDQFVALAR